MKTYIYFRQEAKQTLFQPPPLYVGDTVNLTVVGDPFCHSLWVKISKVCSEGYHIGEAVNQPHSIFFAGGDESAKNADVNENLNSSVSFGICMKHYLVRRILQR
jgi:hypothetical protein